MGFRPVVSGISIDVDTGPFPGVLLADPPAQDQFSFTVDLLQAGPVLIDARMVLQLDGANINSEQGVNEPIVGGYHVLVDAAMNTYQPTKQQNSSIFQMVGPQPNGGFFLPHSVVSYFEVDGVTIPMGQYTVVTTVNKNVADAGGGFVFLASLLTIVTKRG